MKVDCGRCGKYLDGKSIELYGGQIYLCSSCQKSFNRAGDSYKMKMILFNAIRLDNKDFKNTKVNCQYCMDLYKFDDLTIDHVQPKSNLPEKATAQSLWNAVVSCRECNDEKGLMSYNDFMMSDYIINKRIKNNTIDSVVLL